MLSAHCDTNDSLI